MKTVRDTIVLNSDKHYTFENQTYDNCVCIIIDDFAFFKNVVFKNCSFEKRFIMKGDNKSSKCNINKPSMAALVIHTYSTFDTNRLYPHMV